MAELVEKKIEIWKKKLLDMGMRNRLLNYKETKRGTLSISAPDLETLYYQLVQKEKELSFAHTEMVEYAEEDTDQEDTTAPENTSDISEESDRVKQVEISGDLATSKNVVELQSTLKNLRTKAKTAKEEQGINILFLSFGFLEWKESESSSRIIKSPLILVPVELSISGLNDPYVLSLHEDEIVVNPTLSYKLENDFGVILPEFDAQSDNIRQYLNEIKKIARRSGWNTTEEVSLSLLSFLKINMYKDLERREEIITENPIIQALVGEEHEGVDIIPSGMNDYDHDHLARPVDTFQVVDADSSQQDAIVMSQKGSSFVLQGPPGTGKSQTITNIIAEALAEGKKVLFVSEKMAALEVVYKRLSAAGLADLCLVLHSDKANKKEVMDSFLKSLTLPSIATKAEALYKLQTLEKERSKLNEYAKQLHEVIEPLGQSIFDANAVIASLSETQDVIFALDGVEIRQINMDTLNSMLYDINRFSRVKSAMKEDYEDNTWRGSVLRKVNHQSRHDIRAKLTGIQKVFSEYLPYIEELSDELHLDSEFSYEDIPEAVSMLDYCGNAPTFPKEWLGDQSLGDLTAEAKRLQNKNNTCSEKQNTLTDTFHDSVFDLDGQECATKVANCFHALKSEFRIETSEEVEALFRDRDSICQCAVSAAAKLSRERELLTKVYTALNLPFAYNRKTVGDLLDFLKCYHSEMRADESWFARNGWTLSEHQLAMVNAQQLVSEVQRARKKILDEYEGDILHVDYNGLLVRFRTEYTSFFGKLKSGYKQDCNLIRASRKIPVKKLPYDEALRVLEGIKLYYSKCKELEEKEKEFQTMLGGWYCGEDTDFAAVERALNAFHQLTEKYKTIPSRVKADILSGANVEQYSTEVEVIAHLQQDEEISKMESLLHEPPTGVGQLRERCEKAKDVLLQFTESMQPVLEHAKEGTTLAQSISGIKGLAEYQKLKAEYIDEKENVELEYSFLMQDFEGDWDQVLSVLAWVEGFKNHVELFDLSIRYQVGIATEKTYGYKSLTLKDCLENVYRQTQNLMQWFADLFDETVPVQKMTLTELESKVQRCYDNLEGLESWTDFCRAKEQCESHGLSSFVAAVLTNRIEPSAMESVFRKRFYRLWLDAVLPEYPAVEDFRTHAQEELIKEFRGLDREQFQIAQVRIMERAVQRMPNLDSFTSAKDEVGILKRELGKQRNIMPIRKLFNQIPNLLPTLKPCLMMSPLSVSLFLQSENYHFDIVIFDEASQVRTENAVGAISRGSQVIIAGDRHQMPPTNFFAAAVSDSDYDTEEEYVDDSSAFESVLDEAVTTLPEISLKWHYRSRNESLITFSNRKIYNNSLVTFPTPSDGGEDGIEFIHVENGIYNRGRGRRTNRIEAERVAEVVFEQFQTHPNRSVGVITFSEAQQEAVENAVTQLRRAHPEYEEFFNEEREEAFFVKNLENVQGDERDTIIFSVGYGKSNPLEELHMNFGPLNKEGGYRRLNVAVTRAKYAIKMVCSFLPTDMRIGDTTPRGVKLLRDYLDYAKNGISVLDNELTVTDAIRTESPFEDAVYDYLTMKGYQVATQVGCSGYRIDMAVRHPSLHGKFVLGVECDGATYHSSRTARERDRLRQSVLESMGWRLHRIWSTDWIKDPVSEGQRLCAAVEDAIANYGKKTQAPVVSRVKFSEVNPLAQYYDIRETAEEEVDDFGFEAFHEIQLPKSVMEAPIPKIAEFIERLVKEQYPVHMQTVYKQCAPLYSNIKVTNKVKNGVDFVVEAYAKDGNWVKKGDFLWPSEDAPVIPRVWQEGEKPRSLEYVAVEELAEAMKVIITKSFGIDKEALMRVAAREYGFMKLRAGLAEYLDFAYEYLCENYPVQKIDGKLSVKE